MSCHVNCDCDGSGAAPGQGVDAGIPWGQQQHRPGLQAAQGSQRLFWYGGSGAAAHAGTPLLCMPPHSLPAYSLQASGVRLAVPAKSLKLHMWDLATPDFTCNVLHLFWTAGYIG